MKITLRQLQVFAAIAAHAHVTRAAEAVAMTQSAASMALADLERQLATALFDRIGRQLVLNEAGRRLLPKAIEVLERVREIEEIAVGGAGVLDLRLGASLTIGNHLMPPLLAELERRHPGSRLHLTIHNSEQIVAELLAYRLDIGFIEGPIEDDRLQQQYWQADQLCVFVAPGHPLAGKNATIDDLRAARWVLREKGSGTREVLERALANAGLTVGAALELEQPEAIRQSVRAGLGIGCLSLRELADALHAGTLAPVHTHFLDLQRSLRIVLQRDKHLSPGLRSVLALCGVDGLA